MHQENKLVQRWKDQIQVMANADATALELAATYDAFREQSDDHDTAIARLKRKKANKCGNGNVEKALALLENLELAIKIFPNCWG